MVGALLLKTLTPAMPRSSATSDAGSEMSVKREKTTERAAEDRPRKKGRVADPERQVVTGASPPSMAEPLPLVSKSEPNGSQPTEHAKAPAMAGPAPPAHSAAEPCLEAPAQVAPAPAARPATQSVQDSGSSAPGSVQSSDPAPSTPGYEAHAAPNAHAQVISDPAHCSVNPCLA